MKKEKAVVVFSGGQDSTTCLFWAMEQFAEVEAVTFNYNQRHKLEIDCAAEIAKELGINGANNTEVNCKIASQGEAKYSKETMNRKHRFVNPQESENHRY